MSTLLGTLSLVGVQLLTLWGALKLLLQGRRTSSRFLIGGGVFLFLCHLLLTFGGAWWVLQMAGERWYLFAGAYTLLLWIGLLFLLSLGKAFPR